MNVHSETNQVSTENPSNDSSVEQQVEEIIAAGAVGRSDAFKRMLRFLASRAHTQKSVKEIEIAIEVFDRDESFDASQDSLIRVYIYKLRAKLDHFYEHAGADYPLRLNIPKNSYLLSLEKNQFASPGKVFYRKLLNRERLFWVWTGLIIGAAIIFLFDYVQQRSVVEHQAVQSAMWEPLLEDNKPVLVVLGDVFVFSELSEEFEQLREIRDFSISSESDFAQRINDNYLFGQSYRDFGVRYLPSAIGFALKNLSAFLGTEKEWRIVLASELTDLDMENSNIVYLGYYTGLNRLEPEVFSDSILQLHPNGNVLVRADTGDVYVGAGQLSEGYRDRYLDYAVFRKTKLANGKTLFALMSARDQGLLHLSEFVFSQEGAADVVTQLEQPSADFEMLLEISGGESGQLVELIRLIHQLDPVN